ncbi:MAG TPA: hypothetical protein VH165_11200, partial [Kofleriaceae bacterium]|nr:hypothetical protein [Kofleriaceae bacterium]
LILFLNPADEYAPITVKASEAFQIITLPMLPVREAKDPHGRVDPQVIRALEELVARRVVLDQVFAEPAAAIPQLALHSGGRLRDVLELARSACELALAHKVTVAHIDRAAEKAAATRRVAFRDGDAERVARVARDKRILNDPMHGYLLLHSLVLQYNGHNGRPWWDIHPLLLLEDDIQRLVSAGSFLATPLVTPPGPA